MFVCLFPLAFTNHLTVFTEHSFNFKLLCCLFSLYIFFHFCADYLCCKYHRHFSLTQKNHSCFQNPAPHSNKPYNFANSLCQEFCSTSAKVQSRNTFFFFFSITLEINNGVTSNYQVEHFWLFLLLLKQGNLTSFCFGVGYMFLNIKNQENTSKLEVDTFAFKMKAVAFCVSFFQCPEKKMTE